MIQIWIVWLCVSRKFMLKGLKKKKMARYFYEPTEFDMVNYEARTGVARMR